MKINTNYTTINNQQPATTFGSATQSAREFIKKEPHFFHLVDEKCLNDLLENPLLNLNYKHPVLTVKSNEAFLNTDPYKELGYFNGGIGVIEIPEKIKKLFDTCQVITQELMQRRLFKAEQAKQAIPQWAKDFIDSFGKAYSLEEINAKYATRNEFFQFDKMRKPSVELPFKVDKSLFEKVV